MRRTGVTSLCLLSIVLGLATRASAEPGPDAIVVTARKRTEDPRDVPQSVTVIPAASIRDAGLRSLGDAIVFVPNLNLVEFSSRRLSFPFLRGIGSGQGDPAVTTYVDGVPQLSIGSTNLPLLDVERIEFLRGPQGTLYGRNALGGLIHVITRIPAETAGLDADGTLGNFGLRELRLRGSVPIDGDRLRIGLAGSLRRRDGYTKNDRTGHDVDDRDALFGRAQVLYLPHEDHEIRLSLHAERARDGGFALSDLEGLRDRPRHIDQDFEGVSERDIVSPSLTWTWTGETVGVTAITSFTSLDTLETSDFDFSALDGVRRRSVESLDAFTQEIRIASAGDADVSWLVGAHGFASDSRRSAANEFRPGGVGIITPVAGIDRDRGRFRDQGLGLFAHATVTLFDALDIGAGIRYDREWKNADLRSTFTSGGVTMSSTSRDLDEVDDEVLPRFDAAYRVCDEVTIYGLAARGFKAGGFNLDAPRGRVAFSPETSWTVELGVKTSLFDDRLRLNAAVFHIDWDDMQLSQFDATVGGYVTNAGESTSRGFEIEANARPVEGLQLFATFGYADTEFASYVDPFGENVRGNDLPFAPETTWSAGAQWSGEIADSVRLLVRGEAVGVGPFHHDAGNRESSRYTLMNFRVAVAGENWRVASWVRNASDEEYVPVAFQPNPADPSVFVGESGTPRTFGLTLSVDF